MNDEFLAIRPGAGEIQLRKHLAGFDARPIGHFQALDNAAFEMLHDLHLALGYDLPHRHGNFIEPRKDRPYQQAAQQNAYKDRRNSE